MGKKVYKINTTDGLRYAIGINNNGEILASHYFSGKYYKTKKNAEKALKKAFG